MLTTRVSLEARGLDTQFISTTYSNFVNNEDATLLSVSIHHTPPDHSTAAKLGTTNHY